MSIRVALTHRTTYRYDSPVELGPQIVRLRPAPHCRTPILSYSQKIEPVEHFINWQQDPFGNFMARLVFPEHTRLFQVTVDLIARMDAINPFDFFLEESAHDIPFIYDDGTRKELAPYLEVTENGPLLKKLVADVDLTPRSTVDFLVDLNTMLHQRIGYIVRMEPGVQTPEETLTRKKGSCRDSAWLFVQMLRHLGYAARFVSGYLIQLKADLKSTDGADGPEADFTDLHAWAEIYVPGAGWIGLDATSGLFAGEGHIPLAATPAPQSAAPISGSLSGNAKVAFDFDMQVTRLKETPRITRPYSREEWGDIEVAGDAIEAKLQASDVRLTMGGEPTFVATNHRDDEEWNIDAVGPNKRDYADKLIRRLQARFAPGGLLHHGQGKWYPGETLPRWAFGLYWRGDGAPLWNAPDLIAPEIVESDTTPGIEEAEKFTRALAQALEIEDDTVQPAYEDPAEFMLKEYSLAPEIDPVDNNLADPEARARMSAVFDRGLNKPVSFILPAQPMQAKAAADKSKRRRHFRWQSERWKTRRKALFLVPGDSAAGYRLPLGSLAGRDGDPLQTIHQLDPFEVRGDLPARGPQRQSRLAQESKLREQQIDTVEGNFTTGYGFNAEFDGDGPAVKTALAVEPRDGKLCIFIPPLRSADEYVDLIQAVEEVASDQQMPVQIEGYAPPHDHRMNVIKVTPDPGVIEINIHPATSWREQVEITKALYEEARMAGLDASKFHIDGRPAGSGGGNHIVVGGATASDSPFLRRPDLLASLVRYWQNHPSLSYLFSGLFIGPTSQAPRFDEARHDSLYELEIALAQVPDPTKSGQADCPPWLVDRLFRHLLVDVTGNTHRSEICIDKLYSPDGPTGRLGLVEFRGFEMPPHPEMSLAQQLIIRALIARFWDQPYHGKLRRHGTALHDKFMLPYFLWQDFEEVLQETSDATGVHLDPDWFKAQFEFRFPRCGTVRYDGIELDLRMALEPWHVLGEEGAIGGTMRFVDSSLDRLQVSVTGVADDRYAVTCNGIALPLHQTGQPDRQIAGVRFRSWLPSSCLHPTIMPHGPLVFDIVDTWNGRSIGGCTHHAVHPGGRNFETRPVNEQEAQGRREVRFSPTGHTPGPFQPRYVPIAPEFPYTLDLRRF
ncbi:MAG: IMP dehydrogenase [Alphaproteobacteria bacterium]|nr:IMP dehydrogenase [Alphaproteobacteria bacterium]MAS48848.1 IMP dehydrogenase [Alphaproteobacteria bacterium]MAX94287.1 IMP dehydrogenase [Alphaproteobacteria bacterium]MBN52764.1 IMP dehydrogenase [Alphaproteobacteria bacterium]OUT39465.1 MAG: IMP dehydrogenase [Micavibrio sp. TMED2]|tara:strand:- start:3278 stop:6655 length:3378 start_codon:yes stop_codon:yes gene_type:complete